MRRVGVAASLAGVIVVALLAGTTVGVMGQAEPSPEPPTYPDGTGVTFEPVGPSMWRVDVPEGDCEPLYPHPFSAGTRTEVAPDGRFWFLDRNLGIFELGSCPILGMGGGTTFTPRSQALGPDGTLWALDEDRFMSWDGADWVIHREGDFNKEDCEGDDCLVYWWLDVAPDGTVWLSGSVVSAFDGTTWTDYPQGEDVLAFGPDGSVWMQGHDDDLYVMRP